MRYLTLIAVVVGGAFAACGGNNLKRTGEGCAASTECDHGLICDLRASPHVCASTGSLDAPSNLDASRDGATHDGRPDARPIDGRPLDAALDAPLVDAPPPVDALPLIDAP